MLEIIFTVITNIFYLLVIAAILPYLIGIPLSILINMIHRKLGIDLASFLDVIAIPGALFKQLPIDTYLMMRNWKTKTTKSTRINHAVSALVQNRTHSFSVYQTVTPGTSSEMNTVDTLVILILSYIPVFVLFIWLKYLSQITFYIIYMTGPAVAGIVIILFTISLIFGGIPAPSETILPVTFYFKKKPQVILALIINFFASLFVNMLYGPKVAVILFLLFSLLNFGLEQYLERRIQIMYKPLIPNLGDVDIIGDEWNI